jgi:hypothetical protein
MTNGFVDVWREGYAVGCERVAAGANPYPAGAEMALDWHDGWCEGMRDRERSGADHEGGGGAAAE